MVRIFVVDDSELMRGHLRAILEQQPEWHVVGEASDGCEAVETFRQHSPHVIVMDFAMPKMDGLEAARRLTEIEPDVPILMVTVDPSPQLAQEAQRAGIRGLCPKAEIKCLFAAITDLLQDGTYFHWAPRAAQA